MKREEFRIYCIYGIFFVHLQPNMANDFFQFKQFTIHQQRCAMKVGTDGTLLGAWARCMPQSNSQAASVLDIGTGTGLIALMMAQRFPAARVVGIDIDGDAVEQAKENVYSSPFSDRISILEADARTFLTSCQSTTNSDFSPFDSVVSNPPYFIDSLTCPDHRRAMARHTESLSYKDLMTAAWHLLANHGEFSVIIPFDCKKRLEDEAFLTGFFKSRECAVKTTPNKQPRRFLMAFQKHSCQVEVEEGVIEIEPNVRSDWYKALTNDFYL